VKPGSLGHRETFRRYRPDHCVVLRYVTHGLRQKHALIWEGASFDAHPALSRRGGKHNE
jgi:hypothetical protein